MSLLVITDELKKEIRQAIYNIENDLKSIDSVDFNTYIGDNEACPLQHSFSDGIYVREIFIPKGMLLTGKIHKHEHPNFLLKGEVMVLTEIGGTEILKAPCSMISKPGTKRALYAITDLVWTTIHHNPTNTQDLKKLEKIVIAKDYKEYDRFILSEKGVVNKIKNKIIKILSL
tara:strand:+ start:21742 stop:22260 length:519 start_codon:yes stop_codon:yes gene_type:complete